MVIRFFWGEYPVPIGHVDFAELYMAWTEKKAIEFWSDLKAGVTLILNTPATYQDSGEHHAKQGNWAKGHLLFLIDVSNPWETSTTNRQLTSGKLHLSSKTWWLSGSARWFSACDSKTPTRQWNPNEHYSTMGFL